MLIIIEIGMMLAGLFLVITRKIPAFVIGGGNPAIEDPRVRQIGLLLLAPAPAVFVLGAVLRMIFGDAVIEVLACAEYTLMIVCLFLSMVMIGRLNKERLLKESGDLDKNE